IPTMALPRVRFTIRRMMIAVAGLAALLSVPRSLWWCMQMIDRREQYKENAVHFRAETPYSARMKKTWEYVASHPWLPVDPDWPTEPE
ncbi:MAG TPA: hypothetical protein VGH33_19705, partial [Isosphaeraceae bacterium]